MPPFEEYAEEIRGLWDSHWLTNMGEKHRTLEAALEEYLGVVDLALFVNGHQALECLLEAMDLHGKVITTPYTFASTTHAIVRKGLTPVFADIKADDYTIDPEQIEALIDEDTCAIVPVHVYGNLCDVEAIDAIAKKHSLKVIYDAAHAFGVRKNGVSSACFGDAAMFSFHATKVFNTIEGGAVCFRDPDFKTKLNRWKNFGIADEETVEYVGGNAKMNEFAAAMGICNLRHLEGEIAKRRAVAERYWERLEALPVVFDEREFGAGRDDVFDALKAEEVYARKYFYPLTNDFDCYRGREGFDSDSTPVAKWVADRVLTMPMYADLAISDVDRICDIVASCAR